MPLIISKIDLMEEQMQNSLVWNELQTIPAILASQNWNKELIILTQYKEYDTITKNQKGTKEKHRRTFGTC